MRLLLMALLFRQPYGNDIPEAEVGGRQSAFTERQGV
jgi:hypothetical protein